MNRYPTINLNQNSSNISWQIQLSTYGRVSLDEILEDVLIIDEETNVEEIEEQQVVLDKIESIVKTYLTNKEQLIYFCSIHKSKKTSEIMRIVGFDDWRTTSNNIKRVYQIIKIYYDYEILNHKDLNRLINKNFSPFEKKIIMLLEKRYTIHEIKDELGFHYSKTYIIIRDILIRINELPEPGASYYNFLIEIRKFKKLNDFTITDEKIETK